MEEKRAHQRLESEEFVLVTVESSSSNPELEGKSFKCLMKDLSAGGLQITTFVEPPIGTVVHLYIAFQHPVRAFRHIGRVVWIKGNMEDETYDVGVEFTDTPRETFEDWTRLVEQMIGRRMKDEG
jgi:Tfp pilus assembly protein PilZ